MRFGACLWPAQCNSPRAPEVLFAIRARCDTCRRVNAFFVSQGNEHSVRFKHELQVSVKYIPRARLSRGAAGRHRRS